MSSIRFREECYGYHSGQTDCTIFAIQDNKPIGKLDISYHKLNGRKEAYINMIEVLPTFQGQGIGRALIHQLVKNVPYEAVNWGLLLDDGSGLKKAMDKEFGTSYKPLEPEEEQESDDIYPEGANMKISELREMVEFAVQQALLESAFEQYDEAAVIPEGTSLEDKMKEALIIALQGADALLKKSGDKNQYVQKAVSLFLDDNGDFSDPDAVEDEIEAWMERELPAMSYRQGYDNRVKNVAMNVVHDIVRNLREFNQAPISESPPEGWHGTVAAMKQHHHTGPGKIDNPYALAHSMKNKGDEPHYKEQPSSKRGKAVHKEELFESKFQTPNFFTRLR